MTNPKKLPNRLVLIGTALPDVGLYGALKAVAADRARDAMLTAPTGAVLLLRCGQIIGPEMPIDGTGVVATWTRLAARGEPLRVDDPGRSIIVTVFNELLERIIGWVQAPIAASWEEELMSLPDPVRLGTLAEALADSGTRLKVASIRTPLSVALLDMLKRAAL